MLRAEESSRAFVGLFEQRNSFDEFLLSQIRTSQKVFCLHRMSMRGASCILTPMHHGLFQPPFCCLELILLQCKFSVPDEAGNKFSTCDPMDGDETFESLFVAL